MRADRWYWMAWIGLSFLLVGCLGGSSRRGDIARASVQQYLKEMNVGGSEIVNAVTADLRAGNRYREHIQDLKNNWITLTVWLSGKYGDILHIQRKGDMVCPRCNGTGAIMEGWRKMVKKKVDMGRLQFACPDCGGTGTLKDQVVERKWLLDAGDYRNPERREETLRETSLADAPPGTADWIEKLGSDDPQERLRACIWLDENYLKEGGFFRNFMPMLKKARYQSQDAERGLMVYQFWAGKGDPEESRRAYYRIYARMSTGKIESKGFWPEYQRHERDYHRPE